LVANNRRNDELIETIQAIRDMVIEVLRNQRLEEIVESQSLIEYTRNKAPQFSKCYSLQKVELWIKEMEKIFLVRDCSDKQKVNYIVFTFIGESEYWWDSTKRLLEGGGITIT